MGRKGSIGLLLAACWLLAGCVTTSEYPLSSPETAQPDHGLVGTWHEKNQTDESVIFSIKNAHWMRMEDRKKGKPPESCDCFVTVIGGERFLNCLNLDLKHPGYTIIRYRTISGHGMLTTWGIDRDKAAEAVRSGKLKGVLLPNKDMVGNPPHPDFDVELQEKNEGLANFIRESGTDALFSDKSSDLYR